jgi:hypothetical protein
VKSVSTQGVMITSEIERESSGEFSTVVYWHAEIFMDSPPYRKIIKWILEELRKEYRVEVLAESIETVHEDFITHHLEIDGKPMQIYWENSLGYIALNSIDQELISSISSYLKGKTPHTA